MFGDSFGHQGYAPRASAPYGYSHQGVHQPYAVAQQQPPSHGGGPSADGLVRTIFITGFPTDVRDRELNNLMRFLPGYEAGQMNWKNGQALGFAIFRNAGQARGACDSLQNLCFDDATVLRCEIARKNMYIRDTGGDRHAGGAPPAPGGGAGGPWPAYGGAGYGGGGGSGGGGGAPRGGYAAAPSYAPAAAKSGAPYRPVGYAPVSNTGDNPPCNTLFIGNLGDGTDEGELCALFAAQPGFCQLKVVRGQKATSCFAEFDDLTTAAAAHKSQQGAVLSSSDRGGVRIQYSKNPFGKKRDSADVSDQRGGDDQGAPAASAGVANGEVAQEQSVAAAQPAVAAMLTKTEPTPTESQEAGSEVVAEPPAAGL